jgi:hypothetical protein
MIVPMARLSVPITPKVQPAPAGGSHHAARSKLWPRPGQGGRGHDLPSEALGAPLKALLNSDKCEMFLAATDPLTYGLRGPGKWFRWPLVSL